MPTYNIRWTKAVSEQWEYSKIEGRMNRTQRQNHKDENIGLVFNVQKFSLHDGRGIRTLIFLKGCPLRCGWCSNPEGQSYSPEFAYNPEKCIGISECGRCIQVCKEGAVKENNDGKILINRKLCNNCGECADDCPSKAMVLFGEYMHVDEVIKVADEDSGFYVRSGGGLTIGGGEPLSQATFAARLFQTAQSRGLDTALETSGYCNWEDLEKVCDSVNQVFFDIKTMDPDKHKGYTGVSNELILENFQKLCMTFPEISIVVRTPIIRGFNDSIEDIKVIVDFLNEIARPTNYELLSYHGFGESKYHPLGRKYQYSEFRPPTQEHMNSLREVVVKKNTHRPIAR